MSGGAVVFLTGLSGAGKSTIAEALATSLRAAGKEVSIVDGDVLRQQGSADLGFDAASRAANIRRAAELAASWPPTARSSSLPSSPRSTGHGARPARSSRMSRRSCWST